MSTIQGTDLFLVQRGTGRFHITALDLKKSAEVPPSRLWRPSDDPRVTTWYDFGDPATITLTGGRVSQVLDKITGAQPLAATLVSRQPLVQGGGIGWANITSTGGLTRVLPAGGSGVGHAMWFMSSSTMGLSIGMMGEGVRVWAVNVSSEESQIQSWLDTAPAWRINMGAAVSNSANRKRPAVAYSNGREVTPTGSRNPFRYADARPFEMLFAGQDDFVGTPYRAQTLSVTNLSNDTGNQVWRGAVLDLVGSTDLSTMNDTALRQKLEGWNAWKHNQAAVLPASHPYRNAAPLT